VARGFGFSSERVKSAEEFQIVFSRAVKSREPWMIVVDSNLIGPTREIFAGPDGGAALYKPH
jgi:hypothetical protein